MSSGGLSDQFEGAGTKILSATEIDPAVSRGHELQGVDTFRAFLGTPKERVKLPVTYIWLNDDDEPVTLSLTGTWYDSRKGRTNRTPEYRLYYPATAEDVVHRARTGDRLFLCQPCSGPLLALFCPADSSVAQQLLWLFGLEATDSNDLTQIDLRQTAGRKLDFAARYVLELLGIEAPADETAWLDSLLRTFGGKFPPTREFSAFARSLAIGIDGLADPDQALLDWMDVEERLFLTLERHIVGERLASGFMIDGAPDVDGFVSYSLKVQNRRKSRAGWALGNHIEALLDRHKILFTREATTEKRNGPDFLFPGQVQYQDPRWPTDRLTMLGAKTSCKDRWRQVLSEADRISRKHLLTLEPGISLSQTTEMERANLQLVLPSALHSSYQLSQREHLMNVSGFLELARSRQDE